MPPRPLPWSVPYTYTPWPQTWYQLLQIALEDGTVRDSRDGPCREIGPASFTIESELVNLTFLEGRDGSVLFGSLEQLTYLAGSDPEPLLVAAPSYARFRDERYGWTGAYGPRLHPGLSRAALELYQRPDSRRAVVPLWDKDDLGQQLGYQPPPLDLPCTLDLVFWRYRNEVRLHAIMRSCDLWLGIVYDLPAFVTLQRAMAWSLGCQAGPVWFTASSLHLYERNVERAREVRPIVAGSVSPWLFPEARAHPLDNWQLLRGWAEGELAKMAARAK